MPSSILASSSPGALLSFFLRFEEPQSLFCELLICFDGAFSSVLSVYSVEEPAPVFRPALFPAVFCLSFLRHGICEEDCRPDFQESREQVFEFGVCKVASEPSHDYERPDYFLRSLPARRTFRSLLNLGLQPGLESTRAHVNGQSLMRHLRSRRDFASRLQINVEDFAEVHLRKLGVPLEI